MRQDMKNIDEIIQRNLPSAARDGMESDGTRVLRRLESEAHQTGAFPIVAAEGPTRSIWRSTWLRAAALILFVLGLASLTNVFVKRPQGFHATVESAGDLSRSSDRNALGAHGSIGIGDVVRTDAHAGSILKLPDGSGIEMQSETELALEQAVDGLRIRLNKGSVLVAAAKQRTGHLYVRTKDVTVSVVGTVFLVHAEAAGSRVGVIQGEVRVERGATSKQLMPGEQLATNELLQSRPMKEEVAWSQNAQAHIALLEQSAAPVAAPARPEVLETFEVASIRPSRPLSEGGRGGGSPWVNPCVSGNITSGAGDRQLRIDPGRLFVRGVTIFGLIAWTYYGTCPPDDALRGEPEWAKTELYDIDATLPSGSPVYTQRNLMEGNAPKIQRMLQNLLADRFKLTLRREFLEMPAYDLIVVKEGKLKASQDDGTGNIALPPGTPVFTSVNMQTSMAAYAKALQQTMRRPIMDKTGLTGLYDIRTEFPRFGKATMRDVLPAQIEEQHGLRLVPTRALIEVFVIEHLERPSPN